MRKDKDNKKTGIAAAVSNEFYDVVYAYAVPRFGSVAGFLRDIVEKEVGITLDARKSKRRKKRNPVMGDSSILTLLMYPQEKVIVTRHLEKSSLNFTNWIRSKVVERLKEEGVDLEGIKIKP